MKKFRRELNWARLACFVAQFFCGLSWVLAIMGGLLVLAALVDWGFVLSDSTREALYEYALWVPGVLLLPVLWKAVHTAYRLPMELDALNEDERHTISSTLQLPLQSRGELTDWLTEQAQQQAAKAVRRARGHYPALRRYLIAVLVPTVAAAVFIGLYSVSPVIFSTLAARLLQPHEDVPPYSPYRFSLLPTKPIVHFGEDISLSCRVEGDTPPSELRLLLRADGVPLQVLPVFRAQDGSFVRVLEKVTAPCEVAFATADGRARSHYVPVQVSYSPRILSGQAVVTPLPYTGLQPTEHVLGGSEIRVPDGSTVAFTLNCSSEITGGYGYFSAAGESEQKQVKVRVSGKSLTAELPLRQAGTLTLQVKDAAGREADTPVHIRLAVLPDTPPSVSINKPEDGSYLVVGQPLAVEVKAEDDYALNRFNLYKALAPYRQHGISVLPENARSHTATQTYDTVALGLRAGDVLELRAEVGDDNPFRFNIVSSPTTRVTVISESEYARILQMELSYDEFLSRYVELEAAIAAAVEALKSGDLSAARREMEQARDLARTFAADFPVFDMDGKLSELSRQIVSVLDENLSEMTAPDSAAVERMLSRLGQFSAELKAETQQAAEVALIARAMEARLRFAQLLERQSEQVRLYRLFMDEYGAASTSEPGKLEGLGAEQATIMQEYIEWEDSLSPLLEELGRHESLLPMYQQVFAMRHACEQAGVEGLMDQAVAESSAHHPADAHSYARQALEGMQQLQSQECSAESCTNAAQQCRSNMCSAAGNTLQQLLDAMKNRSQGKSPGYGVGSGNGSSYMPNAPGGKLIGPSRSRMSQRQSRGRSTGPSAGSRQPTKQGATPVGSSVVSPHAEAPAYLNSGSEIVPAPYRDAVRSYFSH
ncbi:MAG: hypothetical protein IJ503_10355 [Akkermansia sp.]|nr:hypothetical protein [Akkermansia sp.]